MKPGTVTLRIDGVEARVGEGRTVLEAAREAGVYIPTLCSHPDLTPQGGCKLCVVEIEGLPAPVTSCTTEAREGMVVRTKTQALARIRTLAMELILASHPKDCTSCPVYLNCELQAMIQYTGATHSRLRAITKRNAVMDARNPTFLRDGERCIQCGRCVRACKELRDVGVLAYNGKDGESYVGVRGDLTYAEATCRYCGACVEVCPTGALRDSEGLFAKEGPRELRLVPCRNECPAHTDIPGYLRAVAAGRYGEAVGIMREKLTFPLSLGYVCTRACESKCKRDRLNEPVSIRGLKRVAVENDADRAWMEKALARLPATGRKVAVVGAGPAGLTAAYNLSRKGHAVTVFERLPVSGGMMAAGIPSYRLPRAALEGEVEFIRSAGVEIRNGAAVASAPGLLAEGYDAVVVAVGTHAGRRLGIPGSGLANVVTAVDFLRAAALGGAARAPARVVVLGGGNVSFDCARTARRLGALEVRVMCLEAADRMLADGDEVEQGKEEGVVVQNGVTFLEITGEGGAATGVRYERISGFSFDKGRLVVDAVPDSRGFAPADMVIFAAGQGPDLDASFGLELVPGNYVKADPATQETTTRGVFVAGDALYGTKSVIQAIQSGRDAAAGVDRFLGGDGSVELRLVDRPPRDGRIGAVDGFDAIPRQEPRYTPVAGRVPGFAAVEHTLERDRASTEAGRCLQCDLRVDIRETRLWSDYSAAAEAAEAGKAMSE